MHSLLAGWRLSLHRTRADWPIVMAAWLVTLLAAVLLSIGPIYSSAATTAGLHKALADAAPGQTDIQVSLYATGQRAAEIDRPVRNELSAAMEPLGGTVIRDLRSSETFAVQRGSQPAGGDRALIGSLDGLAEHAALVRGTWPMVRASASEPLQVVVAEAVASELHLAPGSVLSLVTQRFDQVVTLPLTLVGTFRPLRVDDPYWHGDPQLTNGIEAEGSDRTLGPFLTTTKDLLRAPNVGSLHLRWAAFPDLERLTLDESAPLRGRLDALPGRMQVIAGNDAEVSTGLPGVLNDVERSLLVARASVLLLMVQLAILAAYAIILTASLLVEHRRVTTSLLRSRGAGPGQVAVLSLAEALLLAIPAVILAPWLAVGALELLAIAGPLADAGVVITPHVTLDAYLAAGAAGIVCVTLLALPALLAARGFAAEQRELSRQETRTFGQRMGLDLALLAVSGIALWQLRLYGAPLTRTVQGTLGLDPLLVAAPAIGLLAGGVLALRILPLLAHLVEIAVSRGRDVVAPLGFRQLARRPLRYTRSALLLMIAMSTGAFAVSYGATWSNSQHDQARFQAGADVRVQPLQGAFPQWAVPRAYGALAPIEQLSPVERMENEVTVAGASADLLALDADVGSSLVLLRSDAADRPLNTMMGSLKAGRPRVPVVRLPNGTAYLRVAPLLDIGSIGTVDYDPDTGEAQSVPLRTEQLREIQLGAVAFVRDGHGLIYRIASNRQPFANPGTPAVLPLAPAGTTSATPGPHIEKGLDGPIDLLGLAVDVWLPIGAVMERGLVGVGAISAAAAAGGPWIAVSPNTAGTWSAKRVQGDTLLVPAEQSDGLGWAMNGTDPQGRDVLFGNGPGVPPAEITFLPTPLATLNDPVPVIANRAFLAAATVKADDTLVSTLDGQARTLSIVGVVDAFPGTSPAQPLLVMDEGTLGLLRLQATSNAKTADEWWMNVPDQAVPTLTAALRGEPYESVDVVSLQERTLALSNDPVALGVIAALTFGFVATALFAIVGLVVSAAVSARQRRTEFALLRALGLSGRQLSAWLWLENGSLVIVSLLAGTLLGVFIAWLVLPFVTVTQQAVTPVPPVLVDVPWPMIGLLDLASLVALAAAVVVIGIGLRRLGVGSILRMGED